ncbi:MAG: hypothetical protein LBI41_05520 [Lactobacillales bacterium]|jgi:hypothetical protein|nr:hypothetical protein [Lactobacillales bacterium]
MKVVSTKKARETCGGGGKSHRKGGCYPTHCGSPCWSAMGMKTKQCGDWR